MKRIIIQLILILIPLCTSAQGNLPLLPLPVLELLQYQVQKGKRAVAPYLSVSMGLGGYQQNWWLMNLVSYGDGMSVLTRILTNLNIHFTDSLQRRIIQALQSLTIGGGALQIVFWNKGYYRALVSGLQSHGYQLQQVKPATNVLRFQREGSSVIADITVWADMYVLELHS